MQAACKRNLFRGGMGHLAHRKFLFEQAQFMILSDPLLNKARFGGIDRFKEATMKFLFIKICRRF